MFLLGHVGITVGPVLSLDLALRKKYGNAVKQDSLADRRPGSARKSAVANRLSDAMTRFSASLRRMDYRLLIVGSLLPDIIDKPVGMVFFRNFFSNGRLFSHSLLFLAVITLLGLFLYRRWGQRWLLILSFGTAMHLLLDEMWNTPQTIFWPFLGWGFEKKDLSNWMEKMWHSFVSSPSVIATEAIGAVILIAFLAVLIRRRRLYDFIRYGRL